MAESSAARTPFNRGEAATYLDVLYGDRPVRVVLAHQIPGGKFSDTESFELPARRDELLNRAQFLTENRKADVWITPGSIRPTGRRSQEDMELGHTVWVDLDGKHGDTAEAAAELAAQGAYVVRSSDTGVHAYLPLNAPLDPADIVRVNRLLTKQYGADPASVDASRLLRLPGTWNHKYDPPQAVVTHTPWAGEQADAADLLRRAPVADEDARPDATREELTTPLSDTLLDLLERTDFRPGQVSEAFHRRVKECKEAGLTAGQATTVLTDWLTDVDPNHRYLKSYDRMADQVARSWSKPDTRDEEIVADPESTPEQKDNAQEKLVLQEMARMDARDEAILRRAAASLAARPKVADTVLDWDALMEQPLPEFLVEDILVEGGIGILAGESGLGKSFVTFDLLLSVASGTPFLGVHEVKQTKTLYVLAEGAYDAHLRAIAWARERGLKRVDGFTIYPEPINLLNDADVDRLADYADENDYDLVCLDTMSQCTPGVNENDNGAMAGVMRAAKRLARTVLVVHHTGKSETAGTRGASSVFGNADMVLRQRRAKRVVNGKEELLPQWFFELYLEKCKAGRDHISLGQFERATVELGPDPRKEGAKITSCVIRPRSVLRVPDFKDSPKNKTERIANQMASTDFLCTATSKAAIKKAWEQYIQADKFKEMDLESAADNTIADAYKMYREFMDDLQKEEG